MSEKQQPVCEYSCFVGNFLELPVALPAKLATAKEPATATSFFFLGEVSFSDEAMRVAVLWLDETRPYTHQILAS